MLGTLHEKNPMCQVVYSTNTPSRIPVSEPQTYNYLIHSTLNYWVLYICSFTLLPLC